MSAEEKVTILVVEDEPNLREGLVQVLTGDEWGSQYNPSRVFEASSASEALRIIKEQDPDLVISDVEHPGISGLELVQRLRVRADLRAFILLTARSSTQDKVAGFDAGVDDYIIKPFEAEELLARIRAVLRRTASYRRAMKAVAPPVPTKDATILVVDPDPELLDLLDLLLSLRGGYQVVTARDVEKAIQTVWDDEPDLVITEIGLPGKDGFELIRQIRQLDADLPIIVLTTRSESIGEVPALNAGANAYIVKPGDNATLLAEVEKLLTQVKAE